MVTGENSLSCPEQGRAFHGGLERGRVDEGLEDGAGGPMRHGVVHLRDAIAASADQRQHLAGVRIESHQRHLRIGDGSGAEAAALFHPVATRVELFHLLVHDVDGGIDGRGGKALQVGIEGGVDAQALEVGVALADLLQKLLVDQVDEVGSFAGVDAGGGEMQRLGLGALRLLLGDGAGFHHRVQHQVAALNGAVRMAVRREVVGPLDHAGQQRAFGEIKLAHVFAEVGLARLRRIR